MDAATRTVNIASVTGGTGAARTEDMNENPETLYYNLVYPQSATRGRPIPHPKEVVKLGDGGRFSGSEWISYLFNVFAPDTDEFVMERPRVFSRMEPGAAHFSSPRVEVHGDASEMHVEIFSDHGAVVLLPLGTEYDRFDNLEPIKAALLRKGAHICAKQQVATFAVVVRADHACAGCILTWQNQDATKQPSLRLTRREGSVYDRPNTRGTLVKVLDSWSEQATAFFLSVNVAVADPEKQRGRKGKARRDACTVPEDDSDRLSLDSVSGASTAASTSSLSELEDSDGSAADYLPEMCDYCKWVSAYRGPSKQRAGNVEVYADEPLPNESLSRIINDYLLYHADVGDREPKVAACADEDWLPVIEKHGRSIAPEDLLMHVLRENDVVYDVESDGVTLLKKGSRGWTGVDVILLRSVVGN